MSEFNPKATANFATDLNLWIADIAQQRGLDLPTVFSACGMAFAQLVQAALPPEQWEKAIRIFADESIKACRKIREHNDA